MGKRPILPGPEAPREFPQVQPEDPHELFPTNNIRHVITETAKLIERVENLVRTVDKLAATVEKGFDKSTSDFKERLEIALKPFDELKGDMKDVKSGIHDIEKKVAFVRGAMFIITGLLGIAVVILGAAARGWFD